MSLSHIPDSVIKDGWRFRENISKTRVWGSEERQGKAVERVIAMDGGWVEGETIQYFRLTVKYIWLLLERPAGYYVQEKNW